MDTNVTPVGLIGLPGLVQPLEAAGLTVIGGGAEFKKAVPPIREARQDLGFIPLLVADSPTHGLSTWLGNQVNSGCTVVLAHPDGEEGAIHAGGVKRVGLPCLLSELVSGLGYPVDQIPVSVREAFVDIDGSVDWTPPHEKEPAPGDGDELEEPLSNPQEAPAPTTGAGVGDTAVHASRAETQAAAATAAKSGSSGPSDGATEAPPVTDDPLRSSHEQFLAPADGVGGRASGQVIVSCSGKGGVGKTTMATSMAQALGDSGYRVVVIDSSTQDSQRIAIGLAEPSRTAYDCILDGEPDLRAGLLSPSEIAKARNRPDKISYYLLAAAPRQAGMVTPGNYLDLVEEARQMADFVVVDTQIVDVENIPTQRLMQFPMISQFLIPLISQDRTWVVNVGEDSMDGVTGTFRALTFFRNSRALHPARTIAVLNKVSRDTPLNEAAIERSVAKAELGHFIGSIGVDNRIKRAMTQGQTVAANPVLRPLLDAVLNRITGDDQFNQHQVYVNTPDRRDQATGGSPPRQRWWTAWMWWRK